MNRTKLRLALVPLVFIVAGSTFAKDRMERTFPFEAGQRLEVRIDMGHISLTTSETDQVRVVITVDEHRVDDVLDLRFDERNGLRIIGRAVRGKSSGSWLSKIFDDDSVEVHFAIEAPRRLDVDFETRGGHLEIDDVEGTVVLATAGGHITFHDIEGTIEAETSGGHIKGGVISGGGVLATSGGHIKVSGAGDDLEVSTSGGHITIDEVNGDLHAETSGGHIRIGSVSDRLEASTSGGHVSVKSAGGDAIVETSGGHIKLENMGGHVRARSGAGGVSVELAPGNSSGVRLSTSHGPINLVLDRGSNYALDAETLWGEIDSDFAIDGLERTRRVDGRIGGGGQEIRLRTGHGDIHIVER